MAANVARIIQHHIATPRQRLTQALSCPPDSGLGGGQREIPGLCVDLLRHRSQVAGLEYVSIAFRQLRQRRADTGIQLIHWRTLRRAVIRQVIRHWYPVLAKSVAVSERVAETQGRDNEIEVPEAPKLTIAERHQFAKDELKEIVGRIWKWVLIGVGLGAALHGFVPDGWFAENLGSGQWWSVAASFPEFIMLKQVMTFRLLTMIFVILPSNFMVVGWVTNTISPWRFSGF